MAKLPDSLTAWLAYLETLHPNTMDLSLARVNVIRDKLNINFDFASVITVAGTNGKGSVVACLQAFYLQAGFSVASYTSPHLCHFNERIKLQEQPISDQDLITHFHAIENARGDLSLTFFEFTTLAAFHYFMTVRPQVIILEVGLGGRLDAVNCVSCDLAIISNIDFDHCEWLGKTRIDIGFEKAGIIRSHTPIICGDPVPPESIVQQAQKLHAPYYQVGRDFFWYQDKETWVWSDATSQQFLNLPLPQILLQNAATAIMAMQCLQTRLPVSPLQLAAGLKHVHPPARQERIVTAQGDVWLDVAHNPQGIAALVERISQVYYSDRPVIHFIFGMMADKDYHQCLALLNDSVDFWYFSDLPGSRAATAATLQAVLACMHAVCFASPQAAWQAALMARQSNEVIVIAGSFVLVGALYDLAMQESLTASEKCGI